MAGTQSEGRWPRRDPGAGSEPGGDRWGLIMERVHLAPERMQGGGTCRWEGGAGGLD